MKKPINKFAVAMWVTAGIVACLNAIEVWAIAESMRDVARQAAETYVVVQGVLRAASAIVAPTILLIGLGALIELVDQIRWNMRPQQ